jgi:hypothetical protein
MNEGNDIEEVVLADFYEEEMNARANIDTAIYVYEFIDGIDLDGPEILTWRMKNKLKKAKKKCLNILCDNLDALDNTQDEDEE